MKRLTIILLFLLSLSNSQAFNFTLRDSLQSIDEIPQIFYKNNGVDVLWVKNGKTHLISSSDPKDFDEKVKELELSYNIPLQAALNYSIPIRTSEKDYEEKYKNIEKFLAISDIHGQYSLFEQLLREHGIIDTKGNWIYGKGHLIINGDIFDRGDGVTEALWLTFKLQHQAKLVGGKVHYLMGNHELMVFDNDLRYINEKYRLTSEILGIPYDRQFSENSFFGRWIKQSPIMVRINDVMFTHAGISPDFIDRELKPEKVNQLFVDSIFTQEKKIYRNNDLLNFLSRTNGPLWYRGYFKDEDLSNKDIDHVLSYLEVNKIIIGHTSHKEIVSLFDGRILGIDSSIKNGKNGEVLIFENGKYYRGQVGGKRVRL